MSVMNISFDCALKLCPFINDKITNEQSNVRLPICITIVTVVSLRLHYDDGNELFYVQNIQRCTSHGISISKYLRYFHMFMSRETFIEFQLKIASESDSCWHLFIFN